MIKTASSDADGEAFKKRVEGQVESGCKLLLRSQSWRVLDRCRPLVANCLSDLTVNLALLH